MNKHKSRMKLIVSTLLVFVFTTLAQAQQATTASGGSAIGSGGSVTYSIGQIVYTASSGTNGSVFRGVQQPYEISNVLGLDEVEETTITLKVYPNPTAHFLNLNLGDFELLNLSFQLVDINGKLIESKKITNSTETVSMEHMPTATYFLKVSDGNKELKTFKIIKN